MMMMVAAGMAMAAMAAMAAVVAMATVVIVVVVMTVVIVVVRHQSVSECGSAMCASMSASTPETC